jgi:hypothetical protein
MAVTMKNAVLWDVTLCGSLEMTSRRKVTIFTLMMKVICSPETLVLTKAIWCQIPEDGIH